MLDSVLQMADKKRAANIYRHETNKVIVLFIMYSTQYATAELNAGRGNGFRCRPYGKKNCAHPAIERRLIAIVLDREPGEQCQNMK